MINKQQLSEISLNNEQLQIISLGSGCFWCTEGIFSSIEGVRSTVIGYGGGNYPNPTYTSVSNNPDEHAEITRITFDSNIISLEELLSVFFAMHNPCKKIVINHKKGELYRSVILYDNQVQKEIIEKFIEDIKSEFELPILTEVRSFRNFQMADIKYQEYYKSNPEKPFCQNVIRPKIENLKKLGILKK